MNYRDANRLFTQVCFAFAPILGSFVSVVWHGGAIWCVFGIVSGRRKLSRDGFMLSMAAFMYLYIIVNIFTFFMTYEDIGDAAKYIPIATFFLFPFSYSIWSISEKEVIARAAIRASMVAGYGALALALFQFYVLNMRAEGGAGNALVFGTVTCMTGAVALAGALSLERRLAPYLFGAFAASVVAIIYSQSRTVWIALIVVTLGVLWIHRSTVRQTFTKRALAISGALCLAVAIWSFDLVWARFELLLHSWQDLAATGNYKTSLGLRVALWELGAQLARESPIIGHGMHETQTLVREGMNRQFQVDAGFTHFHNGLLTLLVESGIVGAVSVAAVFVIAAANAWRTLRRSADDTARFGATLLVIVLATYAICGSTSILIGHDILDSMLMIFLIVGTYLASGTSKLPAEAAPAEPALAASPGGSAISGA